MNSYNEQCKCFEKRLTHTAAYHKHQKETVIILWSQEGRETNEPCCDNWIDLWNKR